MKKIGLSILCGAFALATTAQDLLTIENEKISLSSRGLHNQGVGKSVSIKADGIVVLII